MSKTAIIILNKSNNPLLFNCLSSIQERTSYKDYTIYIGDTGSTVEEIREIVSFIKQRFNTTQNVKLIKFDYYNFSRNNNTIVNKHLDKEEYILFCNNDICLIDDCITKLVNIHQQTPNIGTVGCKLLFGDNTIQHGGQVLYFNKDNTYRVVTHRGLRSSKDILNSTDKVIGNTGGFMLTSRKLFNDIGGFNESYLDCLEDVEYNLQCILRDKTNLYIGDIKAYHYESQTRNSTNYNKENLFMQDTVHRLIPFITKNLQKIKETQLINYIC